MAVAASGTHSRRFTQPFRDRLEKLSAEHLEGGGAKRVEVSERLVRCDCRAKEADDEVFADAAQAGKADGSGARGDAGG